MKLDWILFSGSVISFCVLTLFAIAGTTILDAVGITIDAFRIAGGLLLFVTAFEMVYGLRQERREETTAASVGERAANLAVFPLAIPLLAGPGTISATILLSSQLSADASTSSYAATLALVIVIALLMTLTAGILITAEVLDKYIGTTGKLVITRLLGVMLAALSVQYIADGILAFAKH